MTFQPDEGMMTMSGQAGASGAWYTTEGNAWKVDTQTAGSKAVAKVYQQLLDDKSALTNRVGIRPSTPPLTRVS